MTTSIVATPRDSRHLSVPRSISDDDKCEGCAHCQYRPGAMSTCSRGWPGSADPDGYINDCKDFIAAN